MIKITKLMMDEDIHIFNNLENPCVYDGRVLLVIMDTITEHHIIFDEVGGIVTSGPIYEVKLTAPDEYEDDLNRWKGCLDIY